jgi:hypothetical protein
MVYHESVQLRCAYLGDMKSSKVGWACNLQYRHARLSAQKEAHSIVSEDILFVSTLSVPTRYIEPPPRPCIPSSMTLPFIPTAPLLLHHNTPITTRRTPRPPIRTQTTSFPPTRSLHPRRSRWIRIRERNRRSHPRQLRNSPQRLIRQLLRRRRSSNST